MHSLQYQGLERLLSFPFLIAFQNIRIFSKLYNKTSKNDIQPTNMSKFQHSPIRLNIINKKIQELRISIVVGGGLTISHLKRKIETQFDQLYSKEVVVKLIEDENGFIVSNNSTVEEHFRSGDTVFFTQHDRNEKSTGFNMNMPTNMGEILSTIRFMTGSALEKLDKIDLSQFNVMEIVPQFLHLGFWYTNDTVVAKVYKIFNKIFGEQSIERFVISCSEVQLTLLLKNLQFWMADIPSAIFSHHEIIWELLQLLQKFSVNEKFAKIFKSSSNSAGGKVLRVIQDLSKDQNVPQQFKKISMKVLKNFTGGSRTGTGLGKIKSAYIPSMLGSSTVNPYDLEELLNTLKSGSPDEKVTVLQQIATNTNFEAITEASVRYDYYQKLVMNIFTIKKLKNRKLITLFNLVLSKILANSSKDHIIQIMQKDIIKRVHNFMLQSPTQTHPASMELLAKISRVSTSAGMFNLEKSFDFLNSPYPEFQLLMSQCISRMSEQLPNISSLRFIPGIKEYVKNSLKTNDENISANLLKTLSNLCLDEQCRYQIINLKGVQIFVKFLQTSSNSQICRFSSKGLLNLTISSRQNKAKVLGMIGNILEKFYQGKYDPVTHGYIETIMKSRNI